MDELDLEHFPSFWGTCWSILKPEEDDAALADNFGSKMQAITFRGDYEELKVVLKTMV